MGIFHEMSTIVNRAPVPLIVTFDGQQTGIPLGESQLPKVTVNYAKNQNPIMGSCDPNNPSISGGRYLLGIKDRDNCDPLTKDEWNAHCEAACRLDWQGLVEDALKPGERVVIKGKKNSTQARSSFDAGVRVHSPEQFEASE